MDLILCTDTEATLFGLFDPNIAPDLLYYAYIPVIFVSIFLGIFVLINRNDFNVPNNTFFAFTLIYALYICNEILQWTAVPAGIVNFGWSLIALFFTILPLCLLYFIYTHIEQKDLAIREKIIIGLLMLPVLIFLPTELNTSTFDILYCEGSVNYLYGYIYTLLVATGVSIAAICIRNYLKTKDTEVLFLMLGSITMLLILFFADIASELLGEFEFNLLGPIGMLIFLVIIAYMIVRFKAFDIKLAGAKALVVGIIILIASQFFFVDTAAKTILVATNLALSAAGGYFLVRSVKQEIKQREEIEKLAQSLKKANVRLKELDKLKSEFVSIASHQLRSPLTSIRGYASMLSDGSFGKLPKKAQESAERIEESARLMALAVEEYLNVSRIESGNMKYNLDDFNLKDQVSTICDDVRPTAIKKGLVLMFRSDLNGKGVTHADIGKVTQILHNLINNSLKYTPKGSIHVIVTDDVKAKKLFVHVKDTGIGMNEKTLGKLFQKFERADNANSVNVSGTGLGMFVALSMAKAMKGNITATSEGDGKGSTFTLELPMVM